MEAEKEIYERLDRFERQLESLDRIIQDLDPQAPERLNAEKRKEELLQLLADLLEEYPWLRKPKKKAFQIPFKDFFSELIPLDTRDLPRLAQILVDFSLRTYLSKNQILHLFNLRSYSDMTHEIYYHIGKMFKKYFMARRRQLYRMSVFFRIDVREALENPLEFRKALVNLLVNERYTEQLKELRAEFESVLQSKKAWQQIFSYIRGSSKDALEFRSSISRIVRAIHNGTYDISPLLRDTSVLLGTEFEYNFEYEFKDWQSKQPKRLEREEFWRNDEIDRNGRR